MRWPSINWQALGVAVAAVTTIAVVVITSFMWWWAIFAWVLLGFGILVYRDWDQYHS